MIPILPKFCRAQAIVCVDDDFRALLSTGKVNDCIFPKQGVTYHVRDIYWIPEKRKFGITLIEIYNGPLKTHPRLELNFDEARFEPLDEIKNTEEELMAEVNRILEENLILA